MQDVRKDRINVTNSQYNQLIYAAFCEIGVFWLKSTGTADEVRASQPVGIILSGGWSVYEDGSFDIDPEIFRLNPRFEGCYGTAVDSTKLGGKVVPAGHAGNREYSRSTLSHTTANSGLSTEHLKAS